MSDVLIENIAFTTDEGIGSHARVGLVVLATDFTIEHEFRQVFTAHETGLFTARILNEVSITPQTLSAMEARITDTVNLILPGETLDVVAYGCTSASMVLGEDRVFARIKASRPNAKCTTPATAAFAAFNAFGAKRIAVLTPYRSDVNQIVKNYIENAGFKVPVFGSFNEENDPTVARIDAESISNAVDKLKALGDFDAVFVSCTNVRLMDAVCDIEKNTGLPVTSSNHAMAWHAMRLAGDNRQLPQWGRLYEKPLS